MRDGGGSTEKMSTQAKLNRIMNQSLAVTATVGAGAVAGALVRRARLLSRG